MNEAVTVEPAGPAAPALQPGTVVTTGKGHIGLVVAAPTDLNDTNVGVEEWVAAQMPANAGRFVWVQSAGGEPPHTWGTDDLQVVDVDALAFKAGQALDRIGILTHSHEVGGVVNAEADYTPWNRALVAFTFKGPAAQTMLAALGELTAFTDPPGDLWSSSVEGEATAAVHVADLPLLIELAEAEVAGKFAASLGAVVRYWVADKVQMVSAFVALLMLGALLGGRLFAVGVRLTSDGRTVAADGRLHTAGLVLGLALCAVVFGLCHRAKKAGGVARRRNLDLVRGYLRRAQ